MNTLEPASAELSQMLTPRERSPQPQPVTEPKKRINLLPWTILAIIIVVAAGIAGVMPRLADRAALQAETRELATPSVTVVSPAPGKAISGVMLPAEVRAVTEAPIYARASGYLKRWLVDIGAQVESGQLLAEIDTPELDQEIAQSRSQLDQAQAALALAKTTADRWTQLLKSNSVSAQENAEKQADLVLKQAATEAAGSNVRRLEEGKAFARVTAPFAGVVTSRSTDVGDLITAAAGRELFRLAQTKTLRVYVRVPQNAAPGMALGVIADLTFSQIPGRVFPAKIVRTSGAIDVSSRTLLVELEVDNSKGELLAGSYAEARFHEVQQEAALTLPANTLLFRAEGTQMGIVHEGGKVELRNIQIGRDFGPTVEVLSGLTTKDKVILNPPDALVSGADVRISEPVKAAEKGKEPKEMAKS